MTPATRISTSSRPIVSVVAGRMAAQAIDGQRTQCDRDVDDRVATGAGRSSSSRGEQRRRRPARGCSSPAAERWSSASAYMPWRVEHQPDRAGPQLGERRRQRAPPAARRRSRPSRRVGCRRRPASSSGPTFSWQLPKRSTHSTSATRPSASSRGSGTMPGMQQAGSTSGPSSVELDAVAEVGGGRGEHVAAGERGAGRGEVVLGVVELDGAVGAAGHRDRRREQPVVGPDEHAGAVRRPRSATARRRRADAGIDDREHDARRHVRDRPGQRQRAGADVERADAVGEVDRQWRAARCRGSPP